MNIHHAQPSTAHLWDMNQDYSTLCSCRNCEFRESICAYFGTTQGAVPKVSPSMQMDDYHCISMYLEAKVIVVEVPVINDFTIQPLSMLQHTGHSNSPSTAHLQTRWSPRTSAATTS